jgi:hypothetical protein
MKAIKALFLCVVTNFVVAQDEVVDPVSAEILEESGVIVPAENILLLLREQQRQLDIAQIELAKTDALVALRLAVRDGKIKTASGAVNSLKDPTVRAAFQDELMKFVGVAAGNAAAKMENAAIAAQKAALGL